MKKILSLFVCMLLILALPASAAGVSLKDFNNGHTNFDGDNKMVHITINTADDGILYIYSDGVSVLSDSNHPIYVLYVAKSGDDIVKQVHLSTLTHGKYKVEFYSADTSVEIASASFEFCSPEKVLKNKQDAILASLKSIPNPNGTAVEIMLTSDADVFSIISSASDADMVTYNKVKSKTAIFGKMVSGISALTSFEGMIALLNDAALRQYNEENTTTPDNTQDTTNTGVNKNPPTNVMTSTGGGGGGGLNIKPYEPPVIPPRLEENPDDNKAPDNTGFADMQNHWAMPYADRLKSLGIMNGYEDGSFRGENPITRAELAKTLVEALELPISDGTSVYTDVNADDWHNKYVLAAAHSGIVTGFADGSFKPNQNIVRQDAVLMLYRALSLKIEMTLGEMFYADTSAISEYAAEAAASLSHLKIVTGDDNGFFNPASELSRAELAALVCRSLDCINNK